MYDENRLLKIRTVEESNVFCILVCACVLLGAAISLFFVKTLAAALLVLALPTCMCAASYFILRLIRNALMVNVVNYNGVRNEYLSEVLCQLEWNEIGDFGVAEVGYGLFKGKYIYMSRIYLPVSIKRDIIRRYDPRICIVLPYTSRVCDAVREASGEKIDL